MPASARREATRPGRAGDDTAGTRRRSAHRRERHERAIRRRVGANHRGPRSTLVREAAASREGPGRDHERGARRCGSARGIAPVRRWRPGAKRARAAAGQSIGAWTRASGPAGRNEGRPRRRPGGSQRTTPRGSGGARPAIPTPAATAVAAPRAGECRHGQDRWASGGSATSGVPRRSADLEGFGDPASGAGGRTATSTCPPSTRPVDPVARPAGHRRSRRGLGIGAGRDRERARLGRAVGQVKRVARDRELDRDQAEEHRRDAARSSTEACPRWRHQGSDPPSGSRPAEAVTGIAGSSGMIAGAWTSTVTSRPRQKPRRARARPAGRARPPPPPRRRRVRSVRRRGRPRPRRASAQAATTRCPSGERREQRRGTIAISSADACAAPDPQSHRAATLGAAARACETASADQRRAGRGCAPRRPPVKIAKSRRPSTPSKTRVPPPESITSSAPAIIRQMAPSEPRSIPLGRRVR